jgi:Fe-S-cluster containining protein
MALVHSDDRRIDISVSSQQHRNGIWCKFVHSRKKACSVNARHPHICNHNCVWTALLNQLYALVGVLGFADAELAMQQPLNAIKNIRFIIDNKNLLFHYSSSGALH